MPPTAMAVILVKGVGVGPPAAGLVVAIGSIVAGGFVVSVGLGVTIGVLVGRIVFVGSKGGEAASFSCFFLSSPHDATIIPSSTGNITKHLNPFMRIAPPSKIYFSGNRTSLADYLDPVC